jgi:hypothetical protein
LDAELRPGASADFCLLQLSNKNQLLALQTCIGGVLTSHGQ